MSTPKVTGFVSLLFSLYKIVKKKRLKCIAVIFLGAGFGFLYGYTKEKQFISEFSIYIDQGGGSPLKQYLGLAKTIGIDLGGSSSSLSPENIAELSKSKRIINQALLSEIDFKGKKEKIINVYIERFGLPDVFPKGLDTSYFRIKSDKVFNLSLNEERVMSDIYKTLKNGLISIDISSKTSIVKVKIKLKDEEVAYQLSVNVLASLEAFFIENIKEEEVATLELLKLKSDSIQERLFFLESQLANLADRNNYRVKSKSKVQEFRMMREIELLNGLYIFNLKNYELAKFSSQENKQVFKVLDEPVLPLRDNSISIILFEIFFSIIFILLYFCYLLFSCQFKNEWKILEAGKVGDA